MMEKLEWSHIDRDSPIWSGSGCDYFSLSAEVSSYWTQYFKGDPKANKDIEDVEYTFNQTNEERESGATFMKTEEYFRELWRDISKVGFEKEDANHCIETCHTLIREEVEWWDERKDLRRYQALKVPGLLEYHSWDVIWRLCKYHKLVAHPLYNHASKRQSVLKKDLPKNAPRIGLKINLNIKQLGDLYRGLFELEVFANEHKSGQFLKAVNGSEHKSIIEPMKFKNNGVLALVIMFLRNYQFIDGACPQYSKWQLFFGIEKTYARKLVSDYGKKARLGEEAKTHRTLPQEYDKLKSLFEAIANKK